MKKNLEDLRAENEVSRRKIKAFVIKNKLMIIFTDGEIITYILNIKDEENNNDKNEKEEENNIEKESYEDGGNIIYVNHFV